MLQINSFMRLWSASWVLCMYRTVPTTYCQVQSDMEYHSRMMRDTATENLKATSMVADAMVGCTDRQTDDVGAGDKPYDVKEGRLSREGTSFDWSILTLTLIPSLNIQSKLFSIFYFRFSSFDFQS